MPWGLCRRVDADEPGQHPRPGSAPVQAVKGKTKSKAKRVKSAPSRTASPERTERPSPSDPDLLGERGGPPEKPVADASTLANIASLLGEAVKDSLVAESWQTRVDGIELLIARARQPVPNTDAYEVRMAAARGVLIGLKDKLVPVYLAALHAVKEVLHGAGVDTRRNVLDLLLPKLVERASSTSNNKARDQTRQLLVDLARDSADARRLIFTAVLSPASPPPPGAAAARSSVGRLGLVLLLSGTFGLDGVDGLPTRAVLDFALPYTSSSFNGEKTAAFRLLRHAFEQNGFLVTTILQAKAPDLIKALERAENDLVREASVLTGDVGPRLVLPPLHARKLPPKPRGFEFVSGDPALAPHVAMDAAGATLLKPKAVLHKTVPLAPAAQAGVPPCS